MAKIDTETPQVDTSQLNITEQRKIKYGKAHFGEFKNLESEILRNFVPINNSD